MKYVNFNRHPKFQPNWNPKEMLQAGIFGGTAFKHIGGRAEIAFPKMPWKESTWGNNNFKEEINAYKVLPHHEYYLTNNKGAFWTALTFFEWYTDFYFNYSKTRDEELDYFNISNWVHYIIHMNRIHEDKIGDKDPRIMQALLEVGINGNWKLNFNSEWMLEQFPLRRYPLQT